MHIATAKNEKEEQGAESPGTLFTMHTYILLLAAVSCPESRSQRCQQISEERLYMNKQENGRVWNENEHHLMCLSNEKKDPLEKKCQNIQGRKCLDI